MVDIYFSLYRASDRLRKKNHKLGRNLRAYYMEESVNYVEKTVPKGILSHCNIVVPINSLFIYEAASFMAK